LRRSIHSFTSKFHFAVTERLVPDDSNSPDAVAERAPLHTSNRALALPVLIAFLPLAALATMYFLLPVLGPTLMGWVGKPPESYGWLGGAIGAGSVMFFFVSHAITPVLGPIGALRLGVLFTTMGGLLVMTGHWPLMLLGAALTGFGYGTTTPTGSQILADFTPKAAWGTLFSIRQAGVPAGGILAGAIAGAMLESYGRVAALCGGLVPILLTGVFLYAIPKRYNQARELKPFTARRLFDWHNIARPFTRIREVEGLAPLVAAGAGLAMGHGAVTQFLVIYLHSGLGLPLARGAMLFALMQGCAIVGRIAIGALADKHGSPMGALRYLAPLSAAACLTLACFDASWGLGGQIAAALAIGMAVGTWNGLYLAEIARRAPPSQISTATSSSAVFTFLSYMITPPLVGILASTVGWRPTFAMIALAPLTSGLLLSRQFAHTEPVE
jgi:MFS family permease